MISASEVLDKDATERQATFRARGLTKIYGTGEVEVRALRGVVLWEGEDVLKLPLTTLFRDGEQWAVFVEEGGLARRRSVEIGHRTWLEAEITDGLAEGERVVLHPSDRVVEGVRIQARSEGS